MKKELQEKLFNDFPLLYGDCSKDMSQSCMFWGIDCGDGWYDILYELSSKIETIIMYIREKNKFEDCYNCGCKFHHHWKDLENPDSKRSCVSIHKLPIQIKNSWGATVPKWRRNIKNYGRVNGFKKYVKEQYKYITWYFKRKINRVLSKLYNHGLHYKKPCHCLEYEIPYPRAAQVKEKFGTMSFYMTTYNSKIEEYIGEAEQQSKITCENCGNQGKIRPGGWIKTLCNSCNGSDNEE